MCDWCHLGSWRAKGVHDGRIEICDWNRDLFANVKKVITFYLVRLTMIPPRHGLVTWMIRGGEVETTHNELLKCLDKVALVAMAKDANGESATIRTWHSWLGHRSFKTVVALAGSSTNCMLITDLLVKVPGLNAMPFGARQKCLMRTRCWWRVLR